MQTVLQKVEHFLQATAMRPTMFGRRAVNDPRLVLDMRNGREPGPQTIERIEQFIAAHAREVRQ